jgi:photosystem II CP47 chlorophyll apoprotein
MILNFWTFEIIAFAHLLQFILLILAAFWYWAYWDLEVFRTQKSFLALDLPKVFAIHLFLASFLALGYGLGHISGYFGPGLWSSDSFGIIGTIRFIKPNYSILSFTPFSYGAISANHISVGIFELFISLWHISARSGILIYNLFVINIIEAVLASSIITALFITIITSASIWYSSITTPLELFGPSR